MAVNPQPELLAIAREQGWRTIITNPWRSARQRQYPRLAMRALRGG